VLKEFQKFAIKGNMVDMAVGIIIGAAFGTVVKSLVSDLIMPPIGLMTGGVDFSDRFVDLSGGSWTTLAQAQAAGAPTLNYGLFANNLLSFVIVAFATFLLVKGINRLRDAVEDPKAPTPVPPPREHVLLEEIRDLLRDGAR